MHEPHNLTHSQAVPQSRQEPAEQRADWQTPDFTVIDTAIEITAYALTRK
ncbi:pyrroloquinoline quinone precursor peptide PqqA [Streptomyces sp. NPDC005373]